MKENNFVTIRIVTEFGPINVTFEILKDLGKNKFVLFAQHRLCYGIKVSEETWVLSDTLDTLEYLKGKPIQLEVK